MIIAVVGLAVLPGIALYANVTHRAAYYGATSPFEHFARLAASAVLILACSLIVFMRGHPDRDIFGAGILLVALIFPYVISPTLPDTITIVWVFMATAVILAVWNIGASIDGLKWLPITASLIGFYSIIRGLIAPEYMMLSMKSNKAIVPNIQLAGPFEHSNALGLYCVLALALTPLIGNVRWRILHGLMLCATIVASASRTALVAAGVLGLWWLICAFRSKKSIRPLGTVLIGVCAATVLTLPLLGWNPDAFTDRGQIWLASLNAWQDSRLLGLGMNWFSTALMSDFIIDGEHAGSGHNLVIQTLVTSGVIGLVVLTIALLAAIRSIRMLEVTNQQIACFGYLITFLVASATEATWIILPNLELFPVAGLVFAVIIVARRDQIVFAQDSSFVHPRMA